MMTRTEFAKLVYDTTASPHAVIDEYADRLADIVDLKRELEAERGRAYRFRDIAAEVSADRNVTEGRLVLMTDQRDSAQLAAKAAVDEARDLRARFAMASGAIRDALCLSGPQQLHAARSFVASELTRQDFLTPSGEATRVAADDDRCSLCGKTATEHRDHDGAALLGHHYSSMDVTNSQTGHKVAGRSQTEHGSPESDEERCWNCGHRRDLHFRGPRGLCCTTNGKLTGSTSDNRCACPEWCGKPATCSARWSPGQGTPLYCSLPDGHGPPKGHLKNVHLDATQGFFAVAQDPMPHARVNYACPACDASLSVEVAR